MDPVFKEIIAKKLIGCKRIVNLNSQVKITPELWRSFMPRLNEIDYKSTDLLYSVQNYPDNFAQYQFTQETLFEKWAAVEVSDTENIPVGLEQLTIPGGKYAVFIHHGTWAEFAQVYQQIFEEWLPNSGYEMDHRPQFEIMEKNYKPDDQNAKEKIWIPVKSSK